MAEKFLDRPEIAGMEIPHCGGSVSELMVRDSWPFQTGQT